MQILNTTQVYIFQLVHKLCYLSDLASLDMKWSQIKMKTKYTLERKSVVYIYDESCSFKKY